MRTLRSRTQRSSLLRSGAGFTLIEVVVTLGVFSIASLMAVNLFVIFIQQQRRTVSQQELQNDARAVVEQVANDLREGVLDYAYYQSTIASPNSKLFTSLSATGNDCLVIRDAFNSQIRYRLNGSIVERAEVIAAGDQDDTCALLPVTLWGSVTPSVLSVSSFTFFASPSEDPFNAKTPQSCGPDTAPSDAGCRWGTLCIDPVTAACQYAKEHVCYCTPRKYAYDPAVKIDSFPLHPRVTVSLHASRAVGKQSISQTFQTTVASRIFKNIDRLNQYAP